MTRPKRKEKDTRRISGYIVETGPLAAAPDGRGARYTEPVRWFIAQDGSWTADRKLARVWPAPAGALAAIRELRRTVMGVEFSLGPADGASLANPYPGRHKS